VGVSPAEALRRGGFLFIDRRFEHLGANDILSLCSRILRASARVCFADWKIRLSILGHSPLSLREMRLAGVENTRLDEGRGALWVRFTHEDGEITID
jgi:hypothetical protein